VATYWQEVDTLLLDCMRILDDDDDEEDDM
jgi:hypothetical protein